MRFHLLVRSRTPWLLGFAITLVAAPAFAVPPPVQLVESVPVESQLGNPALPLARDVWVEMIRGAQRRLDLEQFYLSRWPGEPLDPVLDEIVAAAARGVKVRLLLDARMHATYPRTADSLGGVKGIEVRRIDMGRAGGGTQHSKYFLVDDRELFLGSQNFDWRALEHIHELGVRVRDRGLVEEFRSVFEMDWSLADTTQARPDTSSAGRLERQVARRTPRSWPVRIINGPRDTVDLWPSYTPKRFIPDTTRWDLDAIARLIDDARSEVIVTLLTYDPEGRSGRDETIDPALRRAARRGVRVRLLVADWMADRSAMKSLESLAAESNVEVRLSSVPEWSGGYVPFARVEHCKFMVTDSIWLWVGTSNWEPSYFHASRNLGLTMRNRPLADQARRTFETSWRAAEGIVVKAGNTYVPRIHGQTPPPGRTKYGE